MTLQPLDKIERVRKERKLSIKDLAEQAGLSEHDYKRLLRMNKKRRPVPPNYIRALGLVVGLKMGQLYKVEEEA